MNEQGILRTDLIESAAAELDLDVEVRTRPFTTDDARHVELSEFHRNRSRS